MGIQHPTRWKKSFDDAVNGVPTAAHIELAGRAVDSGGGLTALFLGAAAVCTAHNKSRCHDRDATASSNTTFI